MGFSFSSRSIKQRPSVRAMQTGGYRRAEVPNPNSPVELYGALAAQNPTHVAGGMSAQEFNASMAEKGQERSEAFRQDAQDSGGLANVVQGIKSVPTSKRWDAFFGALQNAGADQLKTGAAAGYDDAPGFFDQPSMGALQQQRSNYLDVSDMNRRRR